MNALKNIGLAVTALAWIQMSTLPEDAMAKDSKHAKHTQIMKVLEEGYCRVYDKTFDYGASPYIRAKIRDVDGDVRQDVIMDSAGEEYQHGCKPIIKYVWDKVYVVMTNKILPWADPKHFQDVTVTTSASSQQVVFYKDQDQVWDRKFHELPQIDAKTLHEWPHVGCWWNFYADKNHIYDSSWKIVPWVSPDFHEIDSRYTYLNRDNTWVQVYRDKKWFLIKNSKMDWLKRIDDLSGLKKTQLIPPCD